MEAKQSKALALVQSEWLEGDKKNKRKPRGILCICLNAKQSKKQNKELFFPFGEVAEISEEIFVGLSKGSENIWSGENVKESGW